MIGRTEFERDNIKKTFTKYYKGREIVESYDRHRPEGTRQIALVGYHILK